MNKDRRKALKALHERLTIAQNKMITAVGEIENIVSYLEQVRDDEQEAYDNSPESVQNGDRGSNMQEAIGHMDNAIDKLREFADFESWTDEALSEIDNAEGY